MKVTWMHGRWREELPGTNARWLLTPGWLAFRPLVALRNLAFDNGWRTIHTLPVPVWSVGNITAGGTGKTPLTRYLASWATKHDLHPAIISRGYGSKAGDANDEARTVKECPVYCNPNRIAGGQEAITAGANCLILDDAFQHRRIHRDLDIVMIDATKPWGSSNIHKGQTLPLGYLRESRAALHRAHVIAISRSSLLTEKELAQLHQQLATFGKPLIHVVDEAPALHTLFEAPTTTAPALLKDKKVVLVSGIGNPLGFERNAQQFEWDVCESLRFPDHHHYNHVDAQKIIAVAKQHHATVVMTGKDAVKLQPILTPDQCGNMYILQSKSTIAEADQNILDQLLTKTLIKK